MAILALDVKQVRILLYKSFSFHQRSHNSKHFVVAPPSCYSGKDSAHLISGMRRRIEELKIGDQVWSLDPLTNELIQDEIILLMHNEPNKTGTSLSSSFPSTRIDCIASSVSKLYFTNLKPSKVIKSV